MKKEEIREVLENIIHWDTCPDSYREIIQEYLEQLQPKESLEVEVIKALQRIHNEIRHLCNYYPRIDKNIVLDNCNKDLLLIEEYATQQSKEVSECNHHYEELGGGINKCKKCKTTVTMF
jgi:hypothetical protein